jgi:hypothetical protein
VKVSLATQNEVTISEGSDEAGPAEEAIKQTVSLARIRPIHREAIRRLVEGQSISQAARDLGLSRSYLNNLKNHDPLFIEELNKAYTGRELDVLKRIQVTSYEALDVVRELMREGKSENIRLQAAMTILDRAGYSKLEKRVSVVADAETVIRELNRRKGRGETGAGDVIEAAIKVVDEVGQAS